jgi:hypothetical protein
MITYSKSPREWYVIPSHDFHRKRDREVLGKSMENVHMLLDFPPGNLKHKSIHNLIGLLIIKAKYGEEGLRSAAEHMLDDLVHEEINRRIKEMIG